MLHNNCTLDRGALKHNLWRALHFTGHRHTDIFLEVQLFQTSILILLLRKFCMKDIKEGETIVSDCVNLQSGDSCHRTCVHWWRAQCELACWCPWRMSLWQTRPAMEIRSIKLISIFTFYHLQIDTDEIASSRTNKHVQSVPHKTFGKPFSIHQIH